MAKLTNDQIIESLKESSLLEIMDLVKAVEEAFGVSAAAPVAVAAASAAEEAPTSVNLVLEDAGSNKVGVIKLIREITGLGLMEAKTMAEKAGAIVKEDMKPEEAKELVAKFTELGAKASAK